MIGVVALVGGGEFTEVCRAIDTELLAGAAGSVGRGLVVLPTASAFEQPSRVVDAALAHFATLGADATAANVLRRADAFDDANVAAVGRAQVVYLSGGSPMHLRSVLKQTPLWDALVDAWRGGATVAAAGAAAMVLTDPMVDPRGGAYTLGLGLVAPLAVVPQHEAWSADRSRRTLELAPSHVPVALLDTGTAIVRDGHGQWRALGQGAVSVHLDGRPASVDVLTSQTQVPMDDRDRGRRPSE